MTLIPNEDHIPIIGISISTGNIKESVTTRRMCLTFRPGIMHWLSRLLNSISKKDNGKGAGNA